MRDAFVHTLAVFLVIQSEAILLFGYGCLEKGRFVPQGQVILPVVMALVAWAAGAAYLAAIIRRKNRKLQYYNTGRFTPKDFLIIFFALMAGVTMAAANAVYAGLNPLFVREMLSGNFLYTVRNAIYYPLEVVLMLQLLICSQRAGELLTGKNMVPWGAFALFLLWGLPHILYHGFADGIVSALYAFVYAIPFYASGKKIKTSYVSMLLLWFC